MIDWKLADGGRIIYIASSTTSFPVPGMAVYGGSKTTPRYLVDILSKEIFSGRRILSPQQFHSPPETVYWSKKFYPGIPRP
ncbi:hypothetical protein [Paraflavitalea devenefica]|uniref:hypothetical protein n=1 Tax=Paraflavitalea devenefica TaxID=2716334 RepID=UPI001FE2C5FB|nr:hypothetical protein [Paraflavitalea devenefica]